MDAIAPLGWAVAIGSMLLLFISLVAVIVLCHKALRNRAEVEVELKGPSFAFRAKVGGAPLTDARDATPGLSTRLGREHSTASAMD